MYRLFARRFAALHWFLLCAVLMPAAKAVAQGSGPAVSLLPSGVQEGVKYTRERTEQMTEQLEPLISDLQKQYETYTTMSCDGAIDEGCQQIRSNIGQQYGKLTKRVSSELPEIERRTQEALKTLGERLRSQVGRNMTPRDVQESLAKTGAAEREGTRASRRPRRQRLGVARNFQALVGALAGIGDRENQMSVATDWYVELDGMLEVIQLAQTSIASAVPWTDGVGVVDERMIGTVNAVATMLFGTTEDTTSGIPSALPERVDTEPDYDWLN